MSNEPLKVSDWSQKYKLVLYVIGLVVVVYFGFKVLDSLGGRTFGLALNQAQFQTATNTQLTCNTTTTSVLGVQSGRTSFVAANMGANIIYLCRASTPCSATSGIPLYATSSNVWSRFEQIDGYTGAYSCAANAAATLLNVSYSQ